MTPVKNMACVRTEVHNVRNPNLLTRRYEGTKSEVESQEKLGTNTNEYKCLISHFLQRLCNRLRDGVAAAMTMRTMALTPPTWYDARPSLVVHPTFCSFAMHLHIHYTMLCQ